MVISNHSPFAKVWFIIQLIAKHLNLWMWIGYVKFNMLHLKISHWILGDSFWFSNKIRSFSGSIRWTVGGAGKAVKEFRCFILLCIVCEDDNPQAKINLYSHLTSAKNRVMLNHSAASKVLECANTMGRWDKHVNRKCKACGLCMSQWVFDLYIYYILLGFHMSTRFVTLASLHLSSNPIPAVMTQVNRGVFLHDCPMVFGTRNESFLTERIDMSQERMRLSNLQLVNHILVRRLGAWRLPWDRFLFCPI